jgi:trimethylamine corrinoid protein
MRPEGVGRLTEVRQAVLEFDGEAVRNACSRALEGGADPLEVFDALREVIAGVGDRFAREELFLPELVGASRAMEAGMAVVRAAIERQGHSPDRFATVVIGTVQGDIHSIGKNIVGALLAAAGAEVLDLGIDVPADRILGACRSAAEGGTGTPLVLAMSALLTTTAGEQERVIEQLREKGLRDRVAVIVGGGAISQEFAAQIGADGYRSTAPEAVGLVRQIAEGRRS